MSSRHPCQCHGDCLKRKGSDQCSSWVSCWDSLALFLLYTVCMLSHYNLIWPCSELFNFSSSLFCLQVNILILFYMWCLSFCANCLLNTPYLILTYGSVLELVWGQAELTEVDHFGAGWVYGYIPAASDQSALFLSCGNITNYVVSCRLAPAGAPDNQPPLRDSVNLNKPVLTVPSCRIISLSNEKSNYYKWIILFCPATVNTCVGMSYYTQ